jgi:hypothetical protein
VINDRFRNICIYKEDEEHVRRKTAKIFFDFNYLREKYDGDKNETMKDATKKYYNLMDDEVSTKVSLRTL